MQHDFREHVTKAVDSFLEGLFETRIAQAGGVSGSYGHLWECAHEVVTSGGKRIRPYLTMVGFGAYNEAIIPIAAAQELLHVAMLVHDDVIDQDLLRRGELNIGGRYLDLYTQYLEDGALARHYADSAALLAGDALISEAYACIGRSSLTPEVRARLIDRLQQSVFDVIGGELLDVEAGIIKDHPVDPLLIARYKTASYSFIGPLVSGAIAADASSRIVSALQRYGESAGIAFQIQDDLLGVFGDEAAVGKTILLDLKEAKETYLIAAHRRLMAPVAARDFETIFGNEHASKADLERLRDDLERSGARAEAEQLIARYFDDALQALDDLDSDWQRQELRDLIERMRARQR